jgi:hypothetical protein
MCCLVQMLLKCYYMLDYAPRKRKSVCSRGDSFGKSSTPAASTYPEVVKRQPADRTESDSNARFRVSSSSGTIIVLG